MGRLSWEDIHRRLDEIDEGIQASTEPSAVQQLSILRQRAEILARPTTEAAAEADALPAIVFRLGTERVAMSVSDIREISAVTALVPIPCTPPWVLGVMNLRGSVVSVVDLRFFLGLKQEGILDLKKVVVVESDEIEVGLAVEDVDEARRIPREVLAGRDPSGQSGFVRAVTEDLVSLLDVRALLADPALIVNDEGGER